MSDRRSDGGPSSPNYLYVGRDEFTPQLFDNRVQTGLASMTTVPSVAPGAQNTMRLPSISNPSGESERENTTGKHPSDNFNQEVRQGDTMGENPPGRHQEEIRRKNTIPLYFNQKEIDFELCRSDVKRYVPGTTINWRFWWHIFFSGIRYVRRCFSSDVDADNHYRYWFSDINNNIQDTCRPILKENENIKYWKIVRPI